jgi:hypothetical protein
MTEVVRNYSERLRSNLHIVYLELGSAGLRGMEADKMSDPSSLVFREREELVSNLIGARHEMLELPENHEGIDIQSVQRFFEEEGLQTGDFLIIDPHRIETFNHIASSRGVASFPTNNEGRFTHGTTIPRLNIAVVPRFSEVEKEYGVKEFESTLVHELAHTSSKWNEMMIIESTKQLTFLPQRINFIRPDSTNGHSISEKGNYYFEEGFAALMEAKYAVKMGSEVTQRSVPDVARVGIEKIIEVIPEYYPALIEARTSVEGLRKIARLTNSIKPGLYRELGRLSYTTEDFNTGTELIEKALT